MASYFECKDGKWVMGSNYPEDRLWPILCKAIGRPELADDPLYADTESRTENAESLYSIFDEAFKSKTREEWMKIFIENQLIFSHINNCDDVLDDEQAIANNYITDFNHPYMGKIKIMAYPIHFGASSIPEQKMAAPDLGEHTDAVLQEIGYKQEEIQLLTQLSGLDFNSFNFVL